MYFRAAFHGIWLLVLSFVLYRYCKDSPAFLLINKAILNTFPNTDIVSNKALLPCLNILMLEMIVGYSLGHILNGIGFLISHASEKYRCCKLLGRTPLTSDFFLRRAIRNNDFEALIFRAVDKSLPVSLTMSNKKAYVGFVMSGIDPTLNSDGLRISPLVSGYRNEEGKIVFTTDYTGMYAKLSHSYGKPGQKHFSQLENIDFEIVLPRDEIQSMNLFDFTSYNAFQNKSQTAGTAGTGTENQGTGTEPLP